MTNDTRSSEQANGLSESAGARAPEFKTDAASVDEAVADVLVRLDAVAANDIEAISDEYHFGAMRFDVDQTALEEGVATSGYWRRRLAPLLNNVTTKIFIRGDDQVGRDGE
ncbi:hypothetical protein ACGLHS_31725 [Variovorax sp. VaC1]|uniref:hypothetical protein n=1 Tax=Variovorax sp. VaC1 TaxID=3373132 RepID=UPI003749F81B